MGYEVSESKNLIADTKCLGSEIDENKRFAKEKFTLVDKDGNRIKYELQSTTHGVGGRFDGYLLGDINIEYEDHVKFVASAKKYFAEHPEDRFNNGSSDISIQADYARVLIKEAAAEALRNKNMRKVTNMEKFFLYQDSYINNVNSDKSNMKFLSWEQVVGRQDFGDDMVEASRKSIENDPNKKKFEHGPFSEEWEESADEGEKSLRERMKRDSRVAQSITTSRSGDGHKIMKVTTPESQIPDTLNVNEVRALVNLIAKRRKTKGK